MWSQWSDDAMLNHLLTCVVRSCKEGGHAELARRHESLLPTDDVIAGLKEIVADLS